MAEEILINVALHEIRVAFLEDGLLKDIYIERVVQPSIIGNLYKGKIVRLLPGIQAAFVDIGLDRPAFLHISDMSAEPEADIQKILRAGQEILVQVYKDAIGGKGPRLTTEFTLSSRYLVLTPNLFQISVSHKIVDEEEKQRLSSLISVSEVGGYILRTAAIAATQAEIDHDKLFLNKLWLDIKSKVQKTKPSEMVYEEPPIFLRLFRELTGHHVERIRVDHLETATRMQEFARTEMPHLAGCIEFYSGEYPIFDTYRVDEEIQNALQRHVNLKSGGYVVFDQTEAMTTIDVNTGSFVGSKNLEQTIFKINLEAIETIARQVRLRNLGGIIIIDFIDMEVPQHKEQLLQSLVKALAKDPARTEVSELSRLGLVQMTRKRTRESLEHILCVNCPVCQRRGSVKSVETVVSEILRELKRTAALFTWNGFLIIASKSVVDYLLAGESIILTEFQEQLGQPVQVRVESFYMQEQYEILPLDKGREISCRKSLPSSDD